MSICSQCGPGKVRATGVRRLRCRRPQVQLCHSTLAMTWTGRTW